MRAQTCSAASRGLDGLGMGRSTCATSTVRVDNPALPKHHADSWSLTCVNQPAQLSAYCLAFTFPTSLCDFLAFKTEFNWDGVALHNRLWETMGFFDYSLLCIPWVCLDVTSRWFLFIQGKVFPTDCESLGNQKLVHLVSLAKCRNFNLNRHAHWHPLEMKLQDQLFFLINI